MSDSQVLPFILIAFPIGFSAIWCSVVALVSVMGGWNKLAGDYATDDPGNVEWHSWQTARMGTMDYKSTLWVAISHKGVYLKTGPSFIYRLMHPPLLIPWEDITEVKPRYLLFFKYAGMKVNGVSVWLPFKFLETLQEHTKA